LRRDKLRLTAGRWTAILTVSVVVAGLGQAAISPAQASPTGSNVYSWGLNVSGELGSGTTVNSDVPVQVTLPGGVTAVAVAMGGNSDNLPDPQNASLALGSDGNLYSWGDNLEGELGTGELPTYNQTGFQCTAACNSTTPVKVDFPSGLSPIAISVGAEHDLALASNGSIYEWGLVDSNQGLGSMVQPTPLVLPLPGGEAAAAIAAGFENDVALGSNGAVYDWGSNTFGELGDGSANTDETGPVQVSLPSGVTATAVATGQTSSEDETSLAIGSDGHIYEWGYGVGGNAPGPSDVPVAVSLPSGVTPTAIATDDGTNLAIGSDGNAYQWDVSNRSPQEVALPAGVTASSLSAGLGTYIVVGGNGQLYAWGSDNDGQYGNGTTGSGQSTPVDVSTAGEPGFSSVVQGVYAVMALGSGGVVSAPVFGTATPALDTIAGTAYTSVFDATGDPAFGLANAPSWLSITANGAVIGTPPAGTTTFSYTVTATNAGGSASLGPFTVTVQPSTTISGQVTGTVGAVVAGAVVQSCMAVTGDECQSTITSSSGTFTLSAAASSSVIITAFPPQGSSLVQTSTNPIAVPPSGVANETISLNGITPLPAGLSVNNTTGTPTVYWASPAPVTATGCSGGVGLVSVVGQDTSTGQYTANLYPLTESPAGSGNYAGTLPPQEPVHGPVDIETSFTCPPVSALLPDSGPSTGGTSVTITGSGFTGATAVDFGSTPATSFSVTSDGDIQAVVPPGSGTVPVTVTVGANVQIAGQYTYMAILSVTPPSGPAGTIVTITGTGIGSASQVNFGGTAGDFTQVSPNEIQAVVPPGSGSTDITVSTPYGSDSTPDTPADQFDYGPPLSPAPVPPPPPVTPPPPAGEANQANSAAALLDTVANSEFLKFVPLDEKDILTVLNGLVNPSCKNSRASAGVAITSNPVVADLSEALIADLSEAVLTSSVVTGFAAGGTAAALAPVIVPIIAASLVGYVVGEVVEYYLEAAINCEKSTGNSTGSSGGSGSSGGGGPSGSRPANGLIDPSGTVVDTNGNPVGGATVTILSSNSPAGPFAAVDPTSPGIEPGVNPETTAADGTFHWDVDAGWYEVQAAKSGCTDTASPPDPAATIGPYPVPPPQVGLTVTLACPGEAPPPTPAVTGLTTAAGPAAGGTTLTVLGTGFTPASSVEFGTAPAAAVTYLSPEALQVTSPAGTGTVDVLVKTGSTTSGASAADSFSYATPPVVTAVSPDTGPASTGQSGVTITGSGFTGATAVLFGSVPASSFTVESDTKIVAAAPPQAPGQAAVLVVTPAGPSAVIGAPEFTFTANSAPVPTTTSVASSADPSVYGSPVTVTATVTPSDGGGTVAFYADGSATAIAGCGTVPPTQAAGGTWTATCSTSALAPGSHTVSASYSGDSGYTGSGATLPGGQTVNRAPLTITASGGSMTYGSAPPAITPAYRGFAGSDGPGSLSPAPACSTTATSASPVGTYPSSCSGAADPDYTISYVSGQVTVTQAGTTLAYTGAQSVSAGASLAPAAALSSPASACQAGQPVTFSLDVNPATGAAGPYSLGSAATAASGAAAGKPVSTAGWQAGAYTMTASYAGTANCAAATATAPLAVTVPGLAAAGAGSYTVTGIGPVKFGFIVAKIPHTSLYMGGISLVQNGAWRLTGIVSSYVKTGSAQGIITGTGSLSWWNPALNNHHGGWQLAKNPVAFTATFSATTKTSPGTFGIQIRYTPAPPQPATLPNSSPLTLQSGIIAMT
jgi:alpha-tubulin suppressor-like RCC1 family protein